jgi:bifunctional DNase/RNase
MSHDGREVRIHSVGATQDEGCVLFLEEIGGARLLPIVAGLNEGKALALKASGLELPRPMTHDLMLSLVEATGFSVVRVLISELREDVFYARVVLEKDGHELSVDARPSDALNVAIRAACPIFVADEVFEKADLLMKPISGSDVAKFRAELESTDPSEAFKALEGKPAPREP